MNPDTRIDVPQLDPANYGPWLLALRAAAFHYDANDHLTGDPRLPTAQQDIQAYQKKKNYLLGKVISTLPNDIANLLIAPDTDPTPHALVTKIKEHLNRANANDHRYLKSLAESTNFLPDMTLSEYVTAHEKIRARMIASQYPNITDPRITVEFMIEGLKHNQSTAQIGLQLIALQPVDIKEFTHQFNRIQAYQGFTMNIPQPYGIPSTALDDIQELLRLLRKKQSPRNDSSRKRDFKPCKFHIAKGVTNPRHSDENCRDPDHPRHRKPRRKPRGTAARATNTDDLPELVTQLQQIIQPHSEVIEDQNTESKFLLDSAAHPSHTKFPTTTMKPLHNPLTTQTITNHTTTCTHSGQVTIQTREGKTVQSLLLRTPPFPKTFSRSTP